MTDAQIIAIAITVLAILAGCFLTNVRIGDFNRSVNLHLDDLRDALLAGMDRRLECVVSPCQTVESEINILFERMDSKLDTIVSMISRLDTRLKKLTG